MTTPNRCTAHSSRTGDPCQRPPIKGATVCRTHGGAAPQVQKAARARILEAADTVAAALVRLALDDETPPAVRVQALRDLLDRAGEGAAQKVEVTTHDGDLAVLDAELLRLREKWDAEA